MGNSKFREKVNSMKSYKINMSEFAEKFNKQQIKLRKLFTKKNSKNITKYDDVKLILACDFETYQCEEFVEVVSFVIKAILPNNDDYPKHEEKFFTLAVGGSIEEFAYVIENIKFTRVEMYFHNLKFDLSYINDYLINYMNVNTKKYKDLKDGSLDNKFIEQHENTISTLVNDDNIVYSAELTKAKVVKKKNGKNIIDYSRVKFFDTLKILPYKLKDIAKDILGLDETKIEYDIRKIKLNMNEEEFKELLEYNERDVDIVCEMIRFLQENDLFKQKTIASNSYRKMLEHTFPQKGSNGEVTINKLAMEEILTPLIYQQAYKQHDLFKEILKDEFIHISEINFNEIPADEINRRNREAIKRNEKKIEKEFETKLTMYKLLRNKAGEITDFIIFEDKEGMTKYSYKPSFLDYNTTQHNYVNKAYFGGRTILFDKFKECEDTNVKGFILDENSMYPYILANKELPYGAGVYRKGKHDIEKDDLCFMYPLYIQRIKIKGIELKQGKQPTFQIKDEKIITQYNIWLDSYLRMTNQIEKYDDLKISASKYVTDILNYDLEIELNLTNIDLKNLLDSYYIDEIEYIDYVMFKSKKGVFKSYIDCCVKGKMQGLNEKNYAKATLYKLLMNTPYGKLGSKVVRVISDMVKDIIDNKEVVTKKTFKNSSYIAKEYYVPMAAFITSYGRDIIIDYTYKINNIKGCEVAYSDTDSWHIVVDDRKKIHDIKKVIPIDGNFDKDGRLIPGTETKEIGLIKLEEYFIESRWICSKRYAQKVEKFNKENNQYEYEVKIKCGGLTDEGKKFFKSVKEFKTGTIVGEYDYNDIVNGKPKWIGNLRPQIAKGGTRLINTKFELQNNYAI